MNNQNKQNNPNANQTPLPSGGAGGGCLGGGFHFEVCANSVESCIAAQQGGADRVELCSGIPEGGTTPSYGEIRQARRVLDEGAARGLKPTRLHVIIRPRGGDFLYTELELQRMLDDIRICRELGADGVVFGCLRPDGTLDTEANARLLEAARQRPTTSRPTPTPSRGEGSSNTLFHQDIASEAIQASLPSGDWGLQSSHRCGCGPTKGSESLIRDGGQAGGGCSITFHRAFDRCANPTQALEELIRQGFDRVLTSGQQPTAELGIPLLKTLHQQAAGRIIILAGCGVSEQNIRRIHEATAISEFHFSAREPLRSQMLFSNPDVYMGAKGADEDTILRTTARRVSETIRQLKEQ